MVVAKEKGSTIEELKVAQSEKVTPSEDVEIRPNLLDDTEEPVVKIRRKDLDNFQGQSTASTC